MREPNRRWQASCFARVHAAAGFPPAFFPRVPNGFPPGFQCNSVFADAIEAQSIASAMTVRQGKRIHQAFEASVMFKGAHALLELVGGLLLAFASTSTITRLVTSLTQEELVRHPRDFVAQYLLESAEQLSISSKAFAAFYLVSHGAIKIVLVVGLLRDKLWAYPASLVVLGIFILYQIYRFAFTHSLGLVALTVFDLVVILLIWHEYSLVRRHRSTQSVT